MSSPLQYTSTPVSTLRTPYGVLRGTVQVVWYGNKQVQTDIYAKDTKEKQETQYTTEISQ